MKRAVLLGAAFLAVALIVAMLWRALDAVQSEQATRRAIVAERVFDELERELDRWLTIEDARPFLHWTRSYVVDNDQGLPVSRTSPLSEARAPGVIAYFQRAPDGTLGSPHPAGVPPDLERILDEVGESGGNTGVAALAPTQSAPPILQVLNKGLQARVRAPTTQAANLGQVGNFVDPGAPAVADARRTDVEVGTFAVRTVEDHLLLTRDVHLDGERWVQGVLLERSAFLDAIAVRALSGLEGVTLDWDATGAYTHRFRPPFQDLRVGVQLPPLATLRSSRALWWMAGCLVLVLVASSALVFRWWAESERVARERTDFVAAVTHELRTPLTSIRMYAEMLEQGVAPEASRASYLATIREEAERLGVLVERVLTFAALERGDISPGETAPLQEVVARVVRVLEPIATARGVTLHTEVSAGLPQVPQALSEQILHNLLDNAIKFAGAPHRVHIRAHADRIEIENTGRAPSPHLLARMFEPFVRGESERTRRTRGTGIGLAIVRGLAAAMGARVVARACPGGTLFTVILPQGMLRHR